MIPIAVGPMLPDLTKYARHAAKLKLDPGFDPTNPDSLSPAQIDAILGRQRLQEPWETAQEYRRQWWTKRRARALQAVRRAIYRGELSILPARDIRCVDCGEYATKWEHRDYDKPLDVVPICDGCNVRRGPSHNAPIFRGSGIDGHTVSDESHTDYTPDLVDTLRCCQKSCRTY